MTNVESLFVPEKKLITKQLQSKVAKLRLSEIKLLEQITTIKSSSQLKQKTSPLLSQQPAAVLKVPLKIESNCKDQESKMAQDCGSCIAKYILCLFNFIFFVSISTTFSSFITFVNKISIFILQILGSLVLALGVWMLADKNSIISLLKSVNSEHIEVSVDLEN